MRHWHERKLRRALLTVSRAAGAVLLISALQETFPDAPKAAPKAVVGYVGGAATGSYYEDTSPTAGKIKLLPYAEKKAAEIPPAPPTKLIVHSKTAGDRIITIAGGMTGTLNKEESTPSHPVYDLDPPTEKEAYYWNLWGLPHTTPTGSSQYATTTRLLGHASDHNRNLVFQWLSDVTVAGEDGKGGDTFTLLTNEGEFTYEAMYMVTPAKEDAKTDPLVNQLRPGIGADGGFDDGLVIASCDPGKDNNVFVVARFISATPTPVHLAVSPNHAVV